MSTGLATSTVTPGKTAPDMSLTTPVNELWACAAPGSRARIPAANSAALNVRRYSLAIRQSFPLDVCRLDSDSHQLGFPTSERLRGMRTREKCGHEYRPAFGRGLGKNYGYLA